MQRDRPRCGVLQRERGMSTVRPYDRPDLLPAVRFGNADVPTTDRLLPLPEWHLPVVLTFYIKFWIGMR